MQAEYSLFINGMSKLVASLKVTWSAAVYYFMSLRWTKGNVEFALDLTLLLRLFVHKYCEFVRVDK